MKKPVRKKLIIEKKWVEMNTKWKIKIYLETLTQMLSNCCLILTQHDKQVVKKNFEFHILHGFHSLIAPSWKTVQCLVLKLKTMSCDHQMN